MKRLTRELQSQPLLIFLHLPKTAGSTLAHIIERQYGPDRSFRQYETSLGQELTKIPSDHITRLRAVIGHYYFGLHNFLPRSCIYVTMLRDPIDRVISYYYFARRRPAHYLYQAAQQLTLQEFVIGRGAAEPNNDQTRLLAATKYSIETGNCSPESLPVAKQHLRDHFAVVGLTEEFDQSLLLMQRALEWRWPFYVRRNVSRNRPGIGKVPAATVEVIRAYNQLDLELYQYAAQLFREQIECAARLGADLRKFKVLNTAYGRLYLSVQSALARVKASFR